LQDAIAAGASLLQMGVHANVVVLGELFMKSLNVPAGADIRNLLALMNWRGKAQFCACWR
jgi:uncharacterized membrane protein YGL010W